VVLTGCAHRAAATGVWADPGATASAPAPGSSGDPSTSPSIDTSTGVSGAPGATPGPTPTPGAPGTPKPTAQPSWGAAAQAVLDQTNAWRTAAGLRPYTMLPGLVASAHKHNLTMSAGCGLSHQCPGEAAFGDRIRAQGVHWTSAGENVGESGPNANTAAAITAAAKGLNTAMYNEKPPNDGHRRNLLSSTFTHIGIDVIRDGTGTVWITEDFTN
jgi:uncharacterized protein YkwD